MKKPCTKHKHYFKLTRSKLGYKAKCACGVFLAKRKP